MVAASIAAARKATTRESRNAVRTDSPVRSSFEYVRNPCGSANIAMIPYTTEVAASAAKMRKNERLARKPAVAGPNANPRFTAKR